MPRTRRRRRRRSRRRQAGPAPQPHDAPPTTPQPWWKSRRSYGFAIVLSFGLWLGGLLFLSGTASSIAVLVGAVGLGIGFSRLITQRLRARRLPPPDR